MKSFSFDSAPPYIAAGSDAGAVTTTDSGSSPCPSVCTPWPESSLPPPIWAPTKPAHALGPDATAAAIQAIFGEALPNADDAISFGAGPLFHWQGRLVNRDGGFWITAQYRSSSLPQIVAGVAKDKRISQVEAAKRVRDYHSGLGNSAVHAVVAARVEIDHLPTDEQIRRYTDLANKIGMPWALWVHSGGKSIHAYFAFSRPLPPDDPIREEIQHLLIAILEGDVTITAPAGVMRLPGYDAPDRQQPVVHLDQSARHEPRELAKRLRMVAAGMGIDSPEALRAAVVSLTLAKSLQDTLKKESSPDARDELKAAIALLRRERANPQPAILALAQAMLGKAPAADGQYRMSLSAHREVTDKSDLARFVGMGKYQRGICPHCPQDKSASAVVLQESPNLLVFCHRGHGTLVEKGIPLALGDVSEPEGSPPTPSTPVDEEEAQRDAAAVAWTTLRNTLRENNAENGGFQDLYERVRARHEAADALDRELVRRCQRTADYAKPLIKRIRDKWLQESGSKYHGCGNARGLYDTQSGGTVAQRGRCKARDCLFCGPHRLAHSIAAICWMPLDEDDEGCFAQKRLYSYDIPLFSYQAFLRFQQRLSPSLRKKGSFGETATRPISQWVAIHAGGRVQVVMTAECEWAKATTSANQPPLETGEPNAQWLADTLIEAHTAQRIALDLGIQYRSRVELAGKITTSRGIKIDPEAVLALTRKHNLALMAPSITSVVDAKRAMVDFGLGIAKEEPKSGIHTTDLGSVQSSVVPNRQVAEQLWQSVTTIRPKYTEEEGEEDRTDRYQFSEVDPENGANTLAQMFGD